MSELNRRHPVIRWVLLSCLMFALVASGCARPEPKVEPVADAPVEAAPEIADVTASEVDVDSTLAEVEASEAPLEVAEEPKIEPERFILLTPDGPLIVAIEILIDGEPQQGLVDQLLDAAFAPLGDKTPRWSALLENDAFTSGQFGNPPVSSGRAGQQLIDGYDVNRNGLVERDEMAALLSAGNDYGRHFSVQATDDFASGRGGATFELMDQDENGRLSRAEISAGSARLLTRDSNDDMVIAAGEMRPRAMPGMPGMRMEQAVVDNRPQTAFELVRYRANSIFYAMNDLYDMGDGLDKACFELAPHLLTECDTNRNGRLEQREVAGLVGAASDVCLRIRLGQRGDHELIELRSTHEDLAAETQLSGGLLTLRFPRFKVQVTVDDRGAGENYRKLQVNVRAGNADDPLFAWLDVTGDSRLSQQEMAAAPERLAMLIPGTADTVSPADLPQGMVCAVRRLVGPREAMYMPVPAEAPRETPGPKWMSAMDANQDGLLSPREFLGTRSQFDRLDANRDGNIDPAEAEAAD